MVKKNKPTKRKKYTAKTLTTKSNKKTQTNPGLLTFIKIWYILTKKQKLPKPVSKGSHYNTVHKLLLLVLLNENF